MAKRDAPISWRPSPEARLALAVLTDALPKLNRNEILNQVVIGAVEIPSLPRPKRDDMQAQQSPNPSKQPKLVMTSDGVKRERVKRNPIDKPTDEDIQEARRWYFEQATGSVKRQQAIPKPGWKRE